MGFLASVWFEILLVCASRVDSMLRSSEIRVQIAKNSELHIRRPVMILKNLSNSHISHCHSLIICSNSYAKGQVPRQLKVLKLIYYLLSVMPRGDSNVMKTL